MPSFTVKTRWTDQTQQGGGGGSSGIPKGLNLGNFAGQLQLDSGLADGLGGPVLGADGNPVYLAELPPLRNWEWVPTPSEQLAIKLFGGVVVAGGAVVGSVVATDVAKGLELSLSATATVGRAITVANGHVTAAGSAFKFSEYYYNKLWATGRGAPFLQAQEVLQTATTFATDRMSGFIRIANNVMEMVYNPTTGEVVASNAVEVT